MNVKRTTTMTFAFAFALLAGCESPTVPDQASGEPEIRTVLVRGATNELEVAQNTGFTCEQTWADGSVDTYVCWKGEGEIVVEYGALGWDEYLSPRLEALRNEGYECTMAHAAERVMTNGAGLYATLAWQAYVCWRE